jgi:hypothetical protein
VAFELLQERKNGLGSRVVIAVDARKDSKPNSIATSTRPQEYESGDMKSRPAGE